MVKDEETWFHSYFQSVFHFSLRKQRSNRENPTITCPFMSKHFENSGEENSL